MIIGYATKTFPWQEITPDNIIEQTNIHLNPKTRSKTLPWQMSLVMVPLMEAKNKMANQTKSHHPTQKPWAQANRKGSSQKPHQYNRGVRRCSP